MPGAIVRQTHDSFHPDLDPAAAGNTVEHDRNIDRFGDRAVMAIEALLRRFVVIRSHEQGGVGSEFFSLRGEGNASIVEFEPVPAMTLQRPLAASIATRITSVCSS